MTKPRLKHNGRFLIAMNAVLNTLIASVLVSPLLLGSAVAQSYFPIAEHHLHLTSQTAADTIAQVRRLNFKSDSTNHSLPVTALDALQAMDNAGMSEALAISSAHIFSIPDLNPVAERGLVEAENDFIAQQVADAKGRLKGLCSVNPLSDYALDEIQRCAQQLALVGVSFHFADANIDLRSSAHINALAQLFEFLNVLNYPALIHLRTRSENYGSVDVKLFIDNVLNMAPSINLQIASFAGSGGFDLVADRAMSEFIAAFADGRLNSQRVQFDLSGSVYQTKDQTQASNYTSNRQLSKRIRQLALDQVLYGTDWPTWPEGLGMNSKMSEGITAFRQAMPLEENEIGVIFNNKSQLLEAQNAQSGLD